MISLPRVRRATVLGLAALLCVPATAVASTPAPAGASAPAPRTTQPETLRLTADPGQPVSGRPVTGFRPVKSATVGVLPRGARRGWQRRTWRTNGYSQVGATWRGAGDPVMQVRSRSTGERWSVWQELEALGDGPDHSSDEGVRGLHGADLWWSGAARDVQVRVRGSGFRTLRLVLIDPGETPADARGAARRAPHVSRSGARGKRPERAPRPRIRRRRAWGANESWREKPRYNRVMRSVHVHHTVNSNDYSRSDVPGLIRGMYRYHVSSLGWSDIGYNFLVDRFGRIWMGRAGGAKYKVRGAHTLGFNHNSTGISAIGNFETSGAPRRMRSAIAKLAAWKLDMHGWNPRSRPRLRSEGSDRYPAGSHPRLPRIAGHRDTNQTACPGINLYRRLPGIRKHAQYRVDRFS